MPVFMPGVHFPDCFYAGKNTHAVGTVHRFQRARHHIALVMFAVFAGKRVVEKAVRGFEGVACF
jgi:hypothetical protein